MTTVARVTCPCGMEVDLNRGRYEDGPFWELWEDLPPDLPPGESVLMDEILRERAAAAAFTDVIECACGRRWRGFLDPPQVVDDDRWQFHTAGPNCHWCYHRDTAFVWGPFSTNVCGLPGTHRGGSAVGGRGSVGSADDRAGSPLALVRPGAVA